MSWLLLATRLVLGLMFLVAGASKFSDLKGLRKTITEFGLPAWSAGSLSAALPFAELAVGLCLLLARTAVAGALGALLLLVTFSLAILINMAFGRRPACHCFGQLAVRPVSFGTAVRAGILAGLAFLLLARASSEPPVSLWAALRHVSAPELMLGGFGLLMVLVLAALGWLALQLFRQNGRLLVRIEALEAHRSPASPLLAGPPAFQGLPVGSPASSFALAQVTGRTVTLEELLQPGKPLLLISTHPNCGPCNELLPEIASWQRTLADTLTIVLLGHGQAPDIRAKAEAQSLSNVLIAPDLNVAQSYQIVGTPSGVIIRPDGRIGSPAMGGAEAIRKLITHRAWVESGLQMLLGPRALPAPLPSTAPPLAIGTQAPAFTLPDLRGNPVRSVSLRAPVVILFWNPACGFCQRMLPQLKDWETNPTPGAPELVLVSAGSVDSNSALGLRSTVLVDDSFATAKLHGARGTPSAVLIGADGRIASALAVGAPVVLELLSPKERASLATAAQAPVV